jgi:hypothetical protein
MGLTRLEFASRLQITRFMDSVVEDAMKVREEKAFAEGEDDPHGRPWHTSFHASSFPGDYKLACPRKALYTLLDIPRDEPFSPKSRLMMDQGKQVELTMVKAFEAAGILLSPGPDEELQLQFADPDIWLTGTTDAVILHPKLGRPHAWESKMKYAKDLERMRVGLQGPDDSHVRQAKTEVAFFNRLSSELWPDLPPLRDGTLFYSSRDNPRVTAEFFIELDPDFMEAGIEKLRKWKMWFDDEILPTQDLPDFQEKGKKPIKRHPLGREFKWTYHPCIWCDFKDTCRTDHQAGVRDLSESVGVRRAAKLRPGYDYEKIREAVYAAWADLE